MKREQAKRVYMCMDKDGDELLTLKEIKRAFMANAFEITGLLEPFPALRLVLRPNIWASVQALSH